MKIVQIISQLGNGGAEKLVVELSNELDKEHEVILVSFRKIRKWMFFPKKLKKSIRVIELDKREGFDIKLPFKLLKILMRERPDIVHIHLESTLRYLMLLIPFFKDIKFVYTIHNNLEYSRDKFNRYSKFWFFKDIRFISLSDEITNEFRKAYPSLNFETINNGIANLQISPQFPLVEQELGGYKTNRDTFLFLYVGRLSYEKNIPLLLDIFSKLVQKNVKLLIIGKDTSPNQDDFKLIGEYPEDNIIYLGAKENIQDYMRCVDALILTSRYEGLPLVVLEALSMGLPIISTPVGSMVDIVVNGKNGFLSDRISTESVLSAIDKLLNLKEKEMEQLKRNNMELFQAKFSIEGCANKYALCYQYI